MIVEFYDLDDRKIVARFHVAKLHIVGFSGEPQLYKLIYEDGTSESFYMKKFSLRGVECDEICPPDEE